MIFAALLTTQLRNLEEDIRDARAILFGDYSRLLNGPVSDEAAKQFRGAQIEAVKKNTLSMIIANVLNVAVILISVWDTPLRAIAICWAATLLVGVIVSARPLWRAPRSRTSTGASATTIHRASRNALIMGAAWSLAPLTLFTGAPEQARFIIVCICSGTIGGGAFMLASIPGAAIGMIVPIIIASIVAITRENGASAVLPALIMVFYGLLLISIVFRHTRELLMRQTARSELERLAARDTLTNLPNIAAFRGALSAAQTRLANSGECYSVYSIDIDNLREINQRLGYADGDILLQQVAKRLSDGVRGMDFLARLEGDQFAVIAVGLNGVATVQAYARQLMSFFNEPFALPGGVATISASVGAAIAADRDSPPPATDQLRNASLALVMAKEQGSGHCHIYSQDDGAGRQARDLLEADLRAALRDGDLKLFYQPFMDLASNAIVGFEALLRWRHPLRGDISPPEIVSIAEERGLIDALGSYVLGEACRAATLWPSTIRVAVNASPLQLRSRTLSSIIETALQTSGLAANRLELEVTENALIDDHELARHVLLSLKKMGLHLALDDFGVGFSSLNYLWSLPFDRIKIDKSFVDEILRKPEAASIVRAILALARDLRLTVTVEGVETVEQLRILRDLDCPEIQGFLISRAMPESQVMEFLNSRSMSAAA